MGRWAGEPRARAVPPRARRRRRARPRRPQAPQPVLTQLCLALALLALHMEAWETVVGDLTRALAPSADDAASKLPCLLELLTVLPEEADNYKVGVTPKRRADFVKMLRASSAQAPHRPRRPELARRTHCAPPPRAAWRAARRADPTAQVLALSAHVCEQCRSQEATTKRMLGCVASWMRHCSLPSAELAASPLLAFAFAAMGSAGLYEAAADMLVEAVHFSSDAREHQALIAAILPQTLRLVPAYDAATQAGDEDLARVLCRLFTETGEQYLKIILRSPEQWALPVAGAVLRGAAHPEPDIAEITFNFWYILAEELAGSGRALDDAQRTEGRRLFAPAFTQLLDALHSLAELPAESTSWSADQHDEYKRFRYAVGDAITDVCKVLSPTVCLERTFAQLQGVLPGLAAAPAEGWRRAECCVWCMRQMVSNGDPTFFGAEVVGQLMRLLPALPAAGELQTTCIRTIGTYASWLNRNHELLPSLLTHVSRGLADQKTAAAASQALKHMCEACAEHLAEDAPMAELVGMYHGTLALPLHPADRVDLVSALAFVISQMEPPQARLAAAAPPLTLPPPAPFSPRRLSALRLLRRAPFPHPTPPRLQVFPAMQAVAQPRVLRLRAVLADGGSGGAAEVANVLEELCALLRGVSPSSTGGADCPQLQDAPHPCVQLLQELWGDLGAVFARHGGDTRCMERLCRCYKHTARNCGTAFHAVVPALLPQVTSWYEERPQSCFLYVCNVCLTQYGGSVSALAPTFAESFGRMATATFRVLSASPSALLDSPDIVDDFFELCSKVLRRMPALLLESEALTTLFHCGCAGLHVQHREANRSVVSFFETLVPLCKGGEHSRVSPAGLEALLRLLTQHGAQVGGHARPRPPLRARQAARRAPCSPPPRRVTRSWCTRSSSGSPACSPPLASASFRPCSKCSATSSPPCAARGLARRSQRCRAPRSPTRRRLWRRSLAQRTTCRASRTPWQARPSSEPRRCATLRLTCPASCAVFSTACRRKRIAVG